MFPVIFQIIIFVGYVGLIYFLLGILDSISESYYSFGGWFSVFCFLLAFPMFAYSKDFYPDVATEGDYTFLFFLSMLLCFTGAAADYLPKSMTRTIHFLGVSISVVSAFLGLWLQYGIYYPAIGTILSVIVIVILNKHVTWWAEIAAFSWLMIGFVHLNIISTT